MKSVKFLPVLLLIAFLASAAVGQNTPLQAWPTYGVDGLGMNVHFREPSPEGCYTLSDQNLPRCGKILDIIADMGLKFVRDGVFFKWTDESKSDFDFSDQHKFVNELSKRGLRPVVLLVYNDSRYEGTEFSAKTVKGRESYAKFCAKVAQEFKGQGIIWEMWNEPNISMFWTPQANVNEYMAAFKEAAEAMRKADPDCIIIGPSTSGIDMDFLQSCFEQGLLEWASAVSIHPYSRVPEQHIDKILQLNSLIDKYGNKPRKKLRLVCSELGVSRFRIPSNGISRVCTEDEQAGILVRQILVSMMAGMPMHIIYNINDYSNNLDEWEHNFGVLHQDLTPKSSFFAVKNITKQLAGMELEKLMDAGDTSSQWKPLLDDYVMVFSNGKRIVIVAWTASQPHLSVFPVLGTPTAVLDMKGKELPIPATQKPAGPDQPPSFGQMMKIKLTGEPIYILVDKKSLTDN